MNWMVWLGAIVALLLLVVVALSLFGEKNWAALMRTHTAQLNSARAELLDRAPRTSPAPPPSPTRFDVRELEGLPAPVQRYFRAVLKDGQPIIAAATIDMAGTINMSATGEQWKPFTSTQRAVNAGAGLRPGYLWNASVRMFPGLHAMVEDSYIAGQGRLLAKLFGLFTVAQAQGVGELARGEFMRYFAEAIWYPTALLPSQGVMWQAVDATSAHATITDGPITLTLLFRFDETGLIASVHADARGAGVGEEMVMLPWECAVSDYQRHDGMLIPRAGKVAWIRPEGRKTYFVGRVTKLHYDFAP